MLVWKGHKARLRSMAFSPDGRFLATTSGGSKFAWLWDATSGKLVAKLTFNDNAARQAVFFPDGRHLAVLDDQRFLAQIRGLHTTVAHFGIYNALTQTLLKLTSVIFLSSVITLL